MFINTKKDLFNKVAAPLRTKIQKMVYLKFIKDPKTNVKVWTDGVKLTVYALSNEDVGRLNAMGGDIIIMSNHNNWYGIEENKSC